MPRTAIVAGSSTSSSPVPMRHVQEGCRAVSASRATQSRISSSDVTAGPGESSPSLNGSKRRLRQDLARAGDCLQPLAAVLLGGQVVEAQLRVLARIDRDDLHRAAGVGVHRADVHLVAMALRGRAVVADRQRQEVEHQVRVGDLVVAADEAAGLEVVRGAGAAAEQQPLEPDLRAGCGTSCAGATDTGCLEAYWT